jgi:hypothetical protein
MLRIRVCLPSRAGVSETLDPDRKHATNASAITEEAAGQQAWKAIVLYGEFESGKQAARLLDRLAERAVGERPHSLIELV